MANPFDQFDPPAAPPEPRKPARAPAQGGNPFYDGVRAAVSPLGGRITSTNGGRHNVGSEHYSGRAVDVGMGRETPEQQASIKARLEASGYRVRDERTRPAGQAVWSGPHLHVSMLDGGSGGGGGGGAMGPSEGNPFDQFDEPAADPVATFRQLNAARQQAAPDAPAPAPDFSNVSVATTFSGGVTPDYAPAFNDVEDPSSLGKIGLRALVGRIPTLAANLVELPGNVAGAIGDALPDGGLQGKLMREGFGAAGDWLRNSLGYENDMQAAGYGAPSVSGGDVLDALNPMSGVPLGERASRVGKFIPETLVGSGPDMLAAVGSLPAYMAARTNEVSTNRATNDGRANPSLTDLAVGAPAAAAESLLERFTTGRLLPGGGAHAPAASLAEALTRVAKETGLQSASGAVEEVIPYLAETAGTQTGANLRDALSQAAGGALAEGALGAAVDGSRAVMTLRAPTAPASLADLVTPPPTLPAVAAEGATAPRQGVAPAAPPTTAVPVEKQEPTPAAVEPTQPADRTEPPQQAEPIPPRAPDMAAATRSIDDRLAALDDTAAGQIPEAEVSALNTERQELDDLLREQDRAKREGLIQSPESRLSPQERATADARRTEIAATLERHRAARTAADQAQRLRTRLENTDSDAGLFEVAREINPTLGTPQADAFRAAGVAESAPINTAPEADSGRIPDIGRAASVQRTAERADSEVSPVAAVGPRVLGTDKNDNVPAGREPEELARSSSGAAADVTPRTAAALSSSPVETGIPVSPRAESQREPAPAQSGQQNITGAITAPERTTSLKNAVTDAERVAEGRDPIIRAARKDNRETVDEAVRAIRETPSIGRETAARLAEGGPVELKDEAVLLVHKVDLRKRRDAAAERAQSPNVSEEARAIAQKEYDDAVQQIIEVDMAADRIGTEGGRLLQFRRRMIAEDYSLSALEQKLRMVVKRDLKPAEVSELKEIADKVATLQRKLDAVESQQASAQVAEMLARLMKQAPGKNATLAERRAAAMESKAALSAMSSARGGQQSIAADIGKPGQARAALADRLGRGVVARLERAGVLVLDDRNGGTWDGTRIGIGNVSPENALGVLLHEVSHANMLDVLGEQGYERALRDLDALEAAGDPLALKAKRRAAKSGETGQRLDDERIAYMVEEATNAAAPAPKVTEFVRSLFSAFRRWAATSAVFRALEKIGVSRPVLKPADFAAFARKGLDRMVADAKNPESAGLRGKVRELENQLRTDTMTGMKNRRAFDEDESLGWPTVAAIDMDGLGKLNEAVGHEAANKVLKALADTFMAAENDSIRVYRHTGGDELAVRFKNPADADRVMADLQRQLDGMNVEMDVTGADGVTRSFTYEGIGITYGTGATYEQADAVAGRRKTEREQAGLRQSKQDPGPSRRVRENSPRPGGRREGDPPAVGAQRSIPEGEDAAPAGADPVAFFHLARIGAFHYADGARTESEWTKRMEGDLGPAADRYRSMLPDAFKASKAQADRVAKGPETVAEAVEAIGDQRRPRDVKRVVRAVVAEGMRGEDAIISATAQALDMDDADVRTLFVQSESQARTLTEAQAELKDLRKQLRDAQKPDPETRYQDTRARDFQRRIEALEERIAAGDFAKREKTEHDLVERNKRLQFELEQTKERFHKYALEAEFQSRTPIGKIFGETVAGINFARAIMTSLDLSAVLRQGGMISLGNPVHALKAFPGSLRAFVSEDADFRIRQDIENRPNAPLYKKFGLELTSIGGDALSRTEEAYASRWVDKLPTAAGGGLIRGSGRSYTAFLNRLRADSFDAMLAALARDGSNPTKEEGKAIANYINVATGRGKVGKNEKSGEVLNTVFFAPRLVASRFQLLAGQPLYGGSNRTRKMIAMEYARFLMGVSVAIGLAMLMRDEDDETKAIELDPRSANFGKVRFGDAFLDPLAGLAQVTVFLARVLSGETRTTTKDELKPLRDSYRLTDVAPGLSDGRTLSKVGYGGRDVPDVITSFLRSKLAPVPGAIINLATGKNMIGQEVTPLSAAGELVTPMSVGSLVDIMESQGMARGTAINLLGLLGMSVQYRKSDEEKAVEEENGVAGAFGFGTADRSTDEQP